MTAETVPIEALQLAHMSHIEFAGESCAFTLSTRRGRHCEEGWNYVKVVCGVEQISFCQNLSFPLLH